MIPSSIIIEFKNSIEDIYRCDGYVLKKDYHYNMDGDIWLLAYNQKEEDVVLPDGIWGVNSTAFYENDDVRRITLPCSVKYMLYTPLKTCPNLREIILPSDCYDIYIGDPDMEDISSRIKFYTYSGDRVIIDPLSGKFRVLCGEDFY